MIDHPAPLLPLPRACSNSSQCKRQMRAPHVRTAGFGKSREPFSSLWDSSTLC